MGIEKMEVLNSLPKIIEMKVERGLAEYETSHGIDVNHKRLSLVLTDQADNVLGVLNAYTAFAEIYIEDLWVEKAHRRNGHARKLLKALEDRFRDKGFNNINLVTNAFQAPGLYQKCGFTVEFVRENIQHPKLTKTFFIKYLNDDKQTQGVLKS